MVSQDGSDSSTHDLDRRQSPDGHTTVAAGGAAGLLPRLTAQLSHDLRVPLSSIIAGLELLEGELGETSDRTVAALLASTTRAANRMVRMLEHNMVVDAVALHRMHNDVDLGNVATQLALDLAPLLERAGATLEVGPLPVVHANPNAMYSVFQNLLTNAVKFTRPGTRPRVSISATEVPYGWRVSMTDNGIGIPVERRMDVFALFSRVESGVEGHGIGLGTVARTVHDLGGRVGADEAPGGGAEVWFELPACLGVGPPG